MKYVYHYHAEILEDGIVTHGRHDIQSMDTPIDSDESYEAFKRIVFKKVGPSPTVRILVIRSLSFLHTTK